MSMMNKRKMIFLFSAEIWILLNDFKRISVSVSRPCNAKYVCWSRIWECIVKTKPSIETHSANFSLLPSSKVHGQVFMDPGVTRIECSKERTMETMTDIIFDNHIFDKHILSLSQSRENSGNFDKCKMIDKPVKSSERGFSYGQLGSAARNWS